MGRGRKATAGSVLVMGLLTLAACAPSVPTPTPTARRVEGPTATSVPAAAPTQVPPTAVPPTRVPTQTPTRRPPTSTPAPLPETPISADNARLVAQVERWSGWTGGSRIAFSPDGRLLAATSPEGVHLVDAATLEEARFIRTEFRPYDLAFSRDGENLVTCASIGRVHVWQESDGELLRTLRVSGSGSVESVALSPDGETIALGTRNSEVVLMRLADGEVLHTLELNRGTVIDLAFSPDGLRVAAATSKGRVGLWRVADGALLSNQTRAVSADGCVAFSPDGALVAVAWGGEQVDLWDAGSGAPLRSLFGHTDRVQSAAFSPDGTVIATAARDHTVRLWRASDGGLLHTLEGHTRPLAQVAFSGDGALLVTSATDDTIRFWGVGPAPAVGETTPAPTSTPTPAGPFQHIDVPPGEIRHLWVAPDGDLWLVGETGIFARADAGWLPVHEGTANRILGTDDAGQVWAVLSDGYRLGSFDGTSWTVYGAEQGWEPGDAHGLVSDRLGRLWTLSGEELRRFDPQSQTWTTLTATDAGFEPLAEPVEPGRALTDVALDGAGNVWVGSCIESGIVIWGQGVRWFDGERWSSSEDTAGQCARDIDVDEAGRVWIGGFDALIRYDPAAGSWSRIPLPPWERTQLVDGIALDAAGNPWVLFTRFGGAGPWHSTAIYALDGGTWVAVSDPNDYLPLQFAFAPDGTAWVCADRVVLRFSDGEGEIVGSVPGYSHQVAVDGAGRVWIAGEGASGAALWLFAPRG
jgi:hypothetical protein